MSFKVRKLDYRPWPVTVSLQECNEETGDVIELDQRFIGHFRPHTEAEIQSIRRGIFGDESSDEGKARIANMHVDDYALLEARFFARLLCGWGAMFAEDGTTPLPYSEAALIALATRLDGPAVRRALNVATNEIRWGIAPLKNAKTSPVPGPKPDVDEVATS